MRLREKLLPGLTPAVSAGNIAFLFLRCALVSVFLGVGFAGLAFLDHSHRLGDGLQHESGAYVAALIVGAACLPAAALTALLFDCLLVLLSAAGSNWRLVQIVAPVIWAVVGGGFTWTLFPLAEHGPKQTVLYSGGALLFFLGSALHAQLWQMARVPLSQIEDFPLGWYTALVLLCASFFGAFNAWVGDSPYVRVIIEHRQRQWTPDKAPPQPLQPPVEEPVPITRVEPSIVAARADPATT
jgi:hypothetical protein